MMKRQKGLTLIELMVVLAVAVIMLAFGVPSFVNIVQSNRATGIANDLIGAFRLARSEAVKNGAAVSVCASNVDQTACNPANWQDGWLVFTDPSGGVNGSLDAGETIIRVWPPMEGSPSIDGAAIPNFVRFLPSGALSSPAIGTGDFSFEPGDCKARQAKEILIQSTGQSRVESINCVN